MLNLSINIMLKSKESATWPFKSENYKKNIYWKWNQHTTILVKVYEAECQCLLEGDLT